MCADECISEKYHINISSQPLKTNARISTNEYYIQLYFEDFDFAYVTYNGKVIWTRESCWLIEIFWKTMIHLQVFAHVYTNCISILKIFYSWFLHTRVTFNTSCNVNNMYYYLEVWGLPWRLGRNLWILHWCINHFPCRDCSLCTCHFLQDVPNLV